MANWQYHAIRDLQDLDSLQEALINLPDQINELKMRATSIRSARMDREAVQGGTSGYEEMLIDSIDRRERLKINYAIILKKTERIEKGLAALSVCEREVLNGMYIHRTPNYLNRLCTSLGYSDRNIYKIKDVALRKFTLSMFGITDM